MAMVIPFPTQRTGDWSESERARLNELAARFAGQSGIEIVFGRSDSGDPWCVILDAQDEVLVHVARVKGAFVAHTLAGDVFAQADDLRSVVERVLGPKWQEERFDVVVPFAAGSRQAQILAAALVVTSFVYHHRVDAAATGEWALADMAAARADHSIAKSLQRGETAQLAFAADAWEVAGSGPAIRQQAPAGDMEQLSMAVMPYELASTSDVRAMRVLAFHSDEEAPVAGAEPAASAADRVLRLKVPDVAPPDSSAKRGGEPDLYYHLVEGGTGDDLLVLDHGAIAIGGDGGDSFVIQALDAPAATTTLSLLGVIVDFDAGADSIAIAGGQPLTVVSILTVRNVFADPNVNMASAPVLAGERIGIDFDGDNQEDGYLLVGNGNDPALIEAVKAAIPTSDGMGSDLPFHAQSAPVMIVPSNEVI